MPVGIPWVRGIGLENGAGNQLANDDDSGDGLNARVIFNCTQDGNYRIVATTFVGGTGPFTLTVSLKEEALCRVILFGEKALCQTTTEFVLHYHGERPHQGLEHRILKPGPEVGRKKGTLECRERLGGLLKYYYRQAA